MPIAQKLDTNLNWKKSKLVGCICLVFTLLLVFFATIFDVKGFAYNTIQMQKSLLDFAFDISNNLRSGKGFELPNYSFVTFRLIDILVVFLFSFFKLLVTSLSTKKFYLNTCCPQIKKATVEPVVKKTTTSKLFLNFDFNAFVFLA